MREVRFRAIHKLTKHWFKDSEIVYQDGEWFEDGRAHEDYRPMNLEKVAVMQYTGLKDKNGAEIYEGDVLKRGDYPDEKPEFIVRFGEFTDSPDFYHEIECSGWYVERIGERDKYNTSLMYVIDMLDGIVCGNIHENTELLERK